MSSIYSQGPKIVINKAGGAGGSLVIKDESIVIGSATSINFVGAQVTAAASGVPGEVTVFIPPVSYAPYFNTGGATVSDISSTSRYIANPTSEGVPYKKGSWAADTLQNTITVGSIAYATPSAFSILNLTSTFKVDVFDADGTSILATHTKTITGNADVTLSNIRIQIIGFTTDSDRYKATATVTISLSSIIPVGGRFSVKITHHNGATDYIKTQGPLFMDDQPTVAAISGTVSIGETVGNVITQKISGIEYYTLNSQFTVGVTGINNLNGNSYPGTQLNVVAPIYGVPGLSAGRSTLTNWTSAWDNINARFDKTNWAITQTEYYVLSTNAVAQAQVIDWSTYPLVNSAVNNIAICTYTNNSTRIYEDFKLETSRLTSTYTAWDNTQSLLTYDNGLQYAGSRLVYPTIDYRIYNPNPPSQQNYSTITGTRYYYRVMYHTGTSHSNGIFRLSDHNWAESDISSGNIQLDISLNGTVWYSLNGDYAGGTLTTGAFCRINADTNNLSLNSQIEFTLSTLFTDAFTGTTGWGIYIRISQKQAASTKYVGAFQITNWV